jgi:uncharacterized protein
MDRRLFLRTCFWATTGNLLGLSGLSRSFAASHLGSYRRLPRVALIIDDIGHNQHRARQFLKLNAPLTFSILPRLKYSYDLSFEIRAKGHEIMLHQPMEPFSASYDPGPGALYSGYEIEKIVRIMDENISAVPFAAGVNNHMGSRFTACPEDIDKALTFIKNRHLYFVDSITSNRSIAYQTARKMDMATAKRNVFIDTIPKEATILKQLAKLVQTAKTYGHAIGIGHPYPQTARALEYFLSHNDLSEITIVSVSQIL